MSMAVRRLFSILVLGCLELIRGAAQTPEGFVSLFNGRDLAGWKIPAGDNGHWRVVDGAIDYDARSEAPGDKDLWTDRAFGDLTMRVDWRIKAAPFAYKGRILLQDGSEKKDENGKPVVVEFPDADSGILLRGDRSAQVNIWCWPAGSGELWSVRTNRKLPAELRAAATPKLHADRNIGEWNRFEITLIADRVTVVLNGSKVIDNARIPGLPGKGAVGLQHHGQWKDGQWVSPPSLLQFRNIYVKGL